MLYCTLFITNFSNSFQNHLPMFCSRFLQSSNILCQQALLNSQSTNHNRSIQFRMNQKDTWNTHRFWIFIFKAFVGNILVNLFPMNAEIPQLIIIALLIRSILQSLVIESIATRYDHHPFRYRYVHLQTKLLLLS